LSGRIHSQWIRELNAPNGQSFSECSESFETTFGNLVDFCRRDDQDNHETASFEKANLPFRAGKSVRRQTDRSLMVLATKT
jgi:hypothetical protein